jgi:hypothetical protein
MNITGKGFHPVVQAFAVFGVAFGTYKQFCTASRIARPQDFIQLFGNR